jgi:hypothetical protein
LLLGFGELFELREGVSPHGLEVLGERSEGFSVGAVEVVPSSFGHRNESSRPQDAKMLRYCSECDIEIVRNLASGLFLIPDELEDSLALRLGDDGEGIGHGRHFSVD